MQAFLAEFRAGDRVAVERGVFRGLAGEIVRVSDKDSICVLRIDGWPSGAHLAIRRDAVCGAKGGAPKITG
jgi:hypothetical protein